MTLSVMLITVCILCGVSKVNVNGKILIENWMATASKDSCTEEWSSYWTFV